MKNKILMVDDDEDYVDAVRFVLESQGYEFIPAYSGKEGFEKLLEHKPHLIILDVMMDKMAGGFIFSRRMRTDPKYSEVSKTPILMLTGMRKKTGFFFPGGKVVKNRFLPVDEFVEKPIKAERLVELVSNMLKKE